jgi:hypothetical protein
VIVGAVGDGVGVGQVIVGTVGDGVGVGAGLGPARHSVAPGAVKYRLFPDAVRPDGTLPLLVFRLVSDTVPDRVPSLCHT